MRKVAVFSLGCKVNRCEGDAVRGLLESAGFDVSSELVPADAYVINTCAVTGEAMRKSRQAVSRCLALNANAKIYVIGCGAQLDPGAFARVGAEFVSGVADKADIADKIARGARGVEIKPLPTAFEPCAISRPYRTRALVKIQDGCDNACSYCVIPILRGRSRSRAPRDVLAEIDGILPVAKEIVLTGINISAYGRDIGSSLVELIRALKNLDVRIRLGSLYAETIDEALLDALFGLKKFCDHFHISVQSGDDSVLRSMNRRYSAEDCLKKIRLIREYDALAGIACDIIVGFPTETDAAFANTLAFVSEARFSDMHIFPFSSRPGVPAANLAPVPSDAVRARRLALQDRRELMRTEFLRKNIGVPQEVLIEETRDGLSSGYSRNYVRVYTRRTGSIISAVPNALYKNGILEG